MVEARTFAVGDEVTDRLVKGVVRTIRGPLCLVEYKVWAGEPTKQEWISAAKLLPCPSTMTIDRACELADRRRVA